MQTIETNSQNVGANVGATHFVHSLERGATHFGQRGATLFGSLVFAGVTALAAVGWFLCTAPFLGITAAVGLYSLSAVVLYLMWIAPSVPRALAVGLGASLVAMIVAVLSVLTYSGGVTLFGAAMILAVVRGGFLYRSKPLRGLVLETVLLTAGFLCAWILYAPTALGLARAIWGFFLVQSAFFVIGGVEERNAKDSHPDAFDQARKRALALMDEPLPGEGI